MKKLFQFPIASLLLIPFAAAQEVVYEFEDIESYMDFSVSGLSEEKTLRIFKSELEDDLGHLGKKYLQEGETLTLLFIDIDMAGDIQEWRNRHNAEIRYIEAVYPPRMKFKYILKNAEGEVLEEGTESISNISFQIDTHAHMKSQYRHFYYETTLLEDWFRSHFRDRKSGKKDR